MGPKLMNLQKCGACKFQFNRVTNKGVGTAILIYNVVIIVVAIGILVAVRSAF